MKKLKDIAGLKFNRWTALSPVRSTRHGVVWLCRCDCGTEREVRSDHLRANTTKSCGCHNREQASARFKKLKSKHLHTVGGKVSSTYGTWHAMIQRCTNPKNSRFHAYGGRGINVCDRWKNSFENFLNDMGERPKGLSLDRIDNDRGYFPENTRWATSKQQVFSQRSTKRITFNGTTLTQSDWARRLGGATNLIYRRLKDGWSLERALTTLPIKP